LGGETKPRLGETPDNEAKEAPMGELTLLEEEEGCSGGKDAPEEEAAVKSASALDEVDEDFQCPKQEDTVKPEGIPGCKTCPRFQLGGTPFFLFYPAFQSICQRCYQGNLASIHSFSFNDQIRCSVTGLNQRWVWTGGKVIG
ncbi:PRG2 protein, partial [Crocuta crocuta]